MKTQTSAAGIIIHHQPYGERHPYSPLAFERAPRDPASGDQVTLGVETGHDPAATSVWCVWRVSSRAEYLRTEAVKVASEAEFDQWQVQLPAFQGYDNVQYRLFASDAAQQVSTEEFSFTVLSWEEVKGIASVHMGGRDLMVRMATSRPGLFVNLAIEADAQNTVQAQLSTSTEPEPAVQNQIASEPWIRETGDLRVSVNRTPVELAITRKSDGLTLNVKHPIRLLVNPDGTIREYQLRFESPSDEAFYGFGERFNALNQRGNTLDNHVFHQFTGQGKYSYIPIPFFLSSRGYGFWLKTECQAHFDLAATQGDRWIVTGKPINPASNLEMRFFLQPDPKKVVQIFTDLTGKPKLPPSWVFGLWMSSNDWNSQAEILRQLAQTEVNDIPASVLVIEAWSDEINFYIWNDADYSPKPGAAGFTLNDFTFPENGRWPDPKAMVDELHKAGLRLVLWQNPTIKQREAHEPLNERQNQADQAHAIEQGYVVQNADGSPHRIEPHAPWFRGSLVLDFSNPDAANWWFKKREYLVTELGVDGFKTDGGEHIWDAGTRFYSGQRGTSGINNYPLAYERAYQQFMEAQRGSDFVLFSRAGYTGSQTIPTHWTGDENSTWEAFRAAIRAMLNAGISGVPFIGWDLGGFAGPIPDSELYLRAAAFSVFCPIMQYHSNVNNQRIPSVDRTPWNIQEQTGDAEVIPVFRHFANLRMNFVPYILAQAYETGKTGLPLMRSLVLEYPHDDRCREFPHEYLFGDALLVAPVIEEGAANWQVYLPAGDWRDIWTDEVFEGPTAIEMEVPRKRIPVFQKKGSVVALNLDESGEPGSAVGNRTDQFSMITLEIFPGGKFETTIVQSGAYEPERLRVETKADDSIELVVPALRQPTKLVVFTVEPAEVRVDGQPLSRQTDAFGWRYAQGRLIVSLPASTEPRMVVVK